MYNRKLNRRRFLQVSVGGVAVAYLSACGSTAQTDSTAATSAAPQGSAAAPAGASGAATGAGGLEYQGSAEFWDWAAPGDARFQTMTDLVASWQAEHPGITLQYKTFGYDEMGTKLLAAASAGSGPPFSNVHNFWRLDLERAGLLTPYPDDMFDWDSLISTPYNRNPETGKIYTSDFALFTDQVYYHTPMLEAEGINPAEMPRNWDDFMKLAEQLTQRDANGRLERAGWTFNHYYSREWLWATLVYQQGGWLWNEDGTAALWNSEEGVRALQLIQDVYYKHKVDDPDYLSMFDAWNTQKAAMYISQGYTGGGHNANLPDLVGKWGTAVTPTFSGNPDPAWGLLTPEEGFCVFAKAPPEIQEVGFSFIKKMMGGDAERVQWALISNGPPDNQALFDNATLKEGDAKNGNSIATQAETLPWRINYGERPLEAEKIWRAMFDQVILTQGDPKAALDEATEQMNAALKDSGKRRLFTERNYKPPTT